MFDFDKILFIFIEEMVMIDVNLFGIGEMIFVGLDVLEFFEGVLVKFDWVVIGDIEFVDYFLIEIMIWQLVQDLDYGE